MVQIQRVDEAVFDRRAPDGPAGDLRAIVAAATAYDGVEVLNEQARLQLANHGLGGAALWLADGGLGGFALLHHHTLDLAVHPDARRRGVGTALARTAIGDADIDVDQAVSAWSHGDHPGAAVLARRLGLARTRELWVMSRPTALPIEQEPPPAGVRVRTYRATDEDRLLRVNAAAYAQHPDQGQLTVEEFRERVGEPWFDARGLFLAVPEDEELEPEETRLLGFHWTKVHPDPSGTSGPSAPYGEVYVVAVNPKAAGRGIGRLLNQVGLRHLRDLGLGEVILYLDGDNEPAIADYLEQGFAHVRSEVEYTGVPQR